MTQIPASTLKKGVGVLGFRVEAVAHKLGNGVLIL